MHGVRCINCNAILKLKQSVNNAKVRCRACGGVFVATSQPLEELQEPVDGEPIESPQPATPAPAPAPVRRPAAGASKPPSHTPGVKPPPKKKPFLVQAIVAGVVAVAAIVLVSLAWYNKTHEIITVRNSDGSTSQMPKAEYDAQKAREEEAKRNPAATKTAAAGSVAPAPKVAGGATRDVPLAEATFGGTFLGGDGSGPLQVMGPVVNKSPSVLAATVTVSLLDKEGKPLLDGKREPLESSMIVERIPPNGKVNYCVTFAAAPDVEYTAKPSVTKTEVDADAVGWMVSDGQIKVKPYEEADDGVKFTVKTTNTTPAAVNDATLYCNLYDSAGVYVGATKVVPKGSRSIAPGASVEFEAQYSDRSGAMKAGVKVIARVIGTR